MSYLMRKEGAPSRGKESELQPTEKMLAPEAFSAAKLKSVATGIVSWKHPSLLFSTAVRADSPFSCKEVNANITKLCSVCRRTFYTFVASFMYSIPDTASLGTEILNNDNCAVHQTFFQMPFDLCWEGTYTSFYLVSWHIAISYCFAAIVPWK